MTYVQSINGWCFWHIANYTLKVDTLKVRTHLYYNKNIILIGYRWEYSTGLFSVLKKTMVITLLSDIDFGVGYYDKYITVSNNSDMNCYNAVNIVLSG